MVASCSSAGAQVAPALPRARDSSAVDGRAVRPYGGWVRDFSGGHGGILFFCGGPGGPRTPPGARFVRGGREGRPSVRLVATGLLPRTWWHRVLLRGPRWPPHSPTRP